MIHHLCRIADHLASSSSIEDAIEAVAMFSSLTGRPSRLYLGKVSKELQVSHVADFGFEERFSDHQIYGEMVVARLAIGHPAHHSLVFIAHDEEYRVRFHELHGSGDDPIWQGSIFMQIGPHFFLSLSFAETREESDEYVNYLNAIRSMLSLFLRTDSFRRADSSRTSEETSPQESRTPSRRLTERQVVILQMIESGDTNATIATKMGYSESLIRQETIAIYRKLGIEGRKDLGIQR